MVAKNIPGQGFLFEEPPAFVEELTFKPMQYPVWTENKANLVRKYLRFFVFITHHGTYIDAFTGPQEPDKPETWAAKLVIENYPRWMRNFFLCELDPKKIEQIHSMVDSQPPPLQINREPKRSFSVKHGDFNDKLDEILSSGAITEKEATFCLLDQRTFECDWNSVKRLAFHKKNDDSNKIELFYFLGVSWLHRAIAGLKNNPDKKIAAWWGREDWATLADAKVSSIVETMTRRFRDELGYKYAYAYPIYGREEGEGRIMYYMIHTSDHPEAPKLMQRAYRQAVAPDETQEQLAMEFGTPME